MTMNLFEFVDLDAPVPIVALVAPAREPFVIRGRLTPAEAEQARRLVPVSRGYLHPTEGWGSGGWPA
ncbi:hypothetical protein [Phormidium sp. FACHB-1136]|jgi:hypothetical protein|uniref:hypothetical protein n=1 Tax=Phormidium sp. FACHB-1136 TaxID=2692848 RepID=UPI0016867F95|nr:hypothetical protein [Phormidium sp. FACHB-1136]MBD2428286.1 hypothetical protein [Phormidium sp. FACHB-1136]